MTAAYLIIENGPLAGKRVELASGTTRLGSRDADFIVDDKHVSRRHAEITRDGDAYYVADLGSRNGTTLNGRELRPRQLARLCDGDRITIARVRDLIFQCSASDSSSPVPVLVDDASESDSASTVQSKVEVDFGSAAMSATVGAEAKLRVLFEITRELGRTLTLDAVLPKVLDGLFRVFLQADRGFIVLTDEHGGLIPRWTKARKPGEGSIRISQTIVRRVIESKQAELLKDIPSDAPESIRGIRAAVCAPLLDSAGNAIGVIQLDTLNQRKSFQQEDLELLACVAIQAGMTIENAQFHEWAMRRKEIEHDLQLANEVQRAFLPKSPPTLAGYDFYAYYRPAVLVGGDYYDYVELPDGRTAILVADVAGKRLAAAMVMARVSAEAKFCLATESRPGAAMNKLNDRLCGLEVERFVTMVILVLDPRTHHVTIVNAGHMPPLCRRADGTVEELGAALSGIALGIIPDQEYQETTITLAPGNRSPCTPTESRMPGTPTARTTNCTASAVTCKPAAASRIWDKSSSTTWDNSWATTRRRTISVWSAWEGWRDAIAPNSGKHPLRSLRLKRSPAFPKKPGFCAGLVPRTPERVLFAAGNSQDLNLRLPRRHGLL